MQENASEMIDVMYLLICSTTAAEQGKDGVVGVGDDMDWQLQSSVWLVGLALSTLGDNFGPLTPI